MKNVWISGKTYTKIKERRELKEKIGCTRSARMKERAAAACSEKQGLDSQCPSKQAEAA